MFKKRERKQYPPGTFIPTRARVATIIQLSLAFMVIAWNFAQPFMKELFDYKSQLLLYQDAMGISSAATAGDASKQGRLTRNAERFRILPSKLQRQIIGEFELLKELSQRTFFAKLQRSIHILLNEIPPFEQAWLLLSMIIPVLLLKRVEGATQAIWLLPLLTLLYAYDNYFFGLNPSTPAESRLFPTENEIVYGYLDEPLSANIFEQREQLLWGWKRYLIKEWTGHNEALFSPEFDLQAEEGEHAFNLARIAALSKSTAKPVLQHPVRELPILLALYLFWNFFFAFSVWKQISNESRPPLTYTYIYK